MFAVKYVLLSDSGSYISSSVPTTVLYEFTVISMRAISLHISSSFKMKSKQHPSKTTLYNSSTATCFEPTGSSSGWFL